MSCPSPWIIEDICVLRHKCCDTKFLFWLPVINRSLKLVSVCYFKFTIDWKYFKEFWIVIRSLRSNFTRLSQRVPNVSGIRTCVQKVKPKMAEIYVQCQSFLSFLSAQSTQAGRKSTSSSILVYTTAFVCSVNARLAGIDVQCQSLSIVFSYFYID
jgi:hypothetical protein